MSAAGAQVSYEDLYARWERGNWRATEIDFTQDKVDWEEKLTDQQRRSALWLYTLFFHGEDSVADNLSPYIDAAPLEEGLLAVLGSLTARHTVLLAAVADPRVEQMAAGRGGVDAVYDAAAAERARGERARMTALLRRRGVEVVDSPPETLAPALADAYLQLKQEGRL